MGAALDAAKVAQYVASSAAHPFVKKNLQAHRLGRTGMRCRNRRSWEVPGLGKLGDCSHIHSNATGYFDSEAYAAERAENEK